MVAVAGAAIVGITIVLVLLIASLIDVFVFGNCDPKFGCRGSVLVGLEIASLAGGISAVSYFPLAIIGPLRVRGGLRHKLVPAIVSGLILSGLFFTIGQWPGYRGVGGLMATWFALSLVVSFAALFIAKSMHGRKSAAS